MNSDFPWIVLQSRYYWEEPDILQVANLSFLWTLKLLFHPKVWHLSHLVSEPHCRWFWKYDFKKLFSSTSLQCHKMWQPFCRWHWQYDKNLPFCGPPDQTVDITCFQLLKLHWFSKRILSYRFGFVTNDSFGLIFVETLPHLK